MTAMSVDFPRGDSSGGLVSTLLDRLRSGRRAVGRRLVHLYFSDWFVIVLTLGVAAVAGGRLTGVVGAGLALAMGLTVAVAVVVANSRNPALTAVGAGVVVVGGVLTAAMLAFIAVLGLRSGVTGLVGGVALACLALASVGAFLTPSREVSSGAILRTQFMAGQAGAGLLVVLALRVLPAADLRQKAADSTLALAAAAVEVAVSTAPAFGLPTFLLTLAVAALAVRSALGRLPIERLLPADKRDAVADALATVRTALSRTFRVGLVVGALTAVVGFAVPPSASADGALAYARYVRVDVLAAELPEPVGGLLAGVLLSEALRGMLLSLALVGASVRVAVSATRWLRRGLGWFLVRVAAPVAGGAAVGVVVGTTLDDPALPARLAAAAPEGVPPEVIGLVAELPLFAAANVLLLLTVAAFGGALFGLLLLRGVLVLPKRAGSAALASVGLFGVAVVAAVVDRIGLALGVSVVALSVWDVGEFRTGLREELPGTAPTLRVEVVHASGSLIVGSVVALVAWALFTWVVPAVSPPDPQIAAAGLVVLTFVTALLTTQVRG